MPLLRPRAAFAALAVLVPLGLALAAAPTWAQTANAAADALFQDGRRLMGEKKYAEACAAFEASQKLDPAVTTLANLADCKEKNEQYASAWALFLDVERQTRGDARQAPLNKAAKERAARLEPRLSYLIVNVPDESRVDGLTITRNGTAVEPVTWNRALPVDGGEYVIEGKAPGHEAWQTRVRVRAEQDKQSVDVPRFKALPVPDPVEVTPGGGGDGGGGDERPVPLVRGDAGLSGKRKAAIGLGAVGLAGLVTGGIFEVMARGTYDDAVAATDNERRRQLTDDANGQRNVAIIAGIAGVACAGAAVFLWVTGGDDDARDRGAWRVVPQVGGDGVGVALTGGF